MRGRAAAGSSGKPFKHSYTACRDAEISAQESRSAGLAPCLSREGFLRAHRVRVHRYAVMFLVDADVLSEATKPGPDPRVLEWLAQHEREIAVDPVILGEIHFGILLLPIGARRARLERWFQEGVERIHCLSWEATTGLRWARLSRRAPHQRSIHADQR